MPVPVYLLIVYLLQLGLAATLGAVVIVALTLGIKFALRRSNLVPLHRKPDIYRAVAEQSRNIYRSFSLCS